LVLELSDDEPVEIFKSLVDVGEELVLFGINCGAV
jgi:hypothetical protein